MARGWESKAVESQQADASESASPKAELSPAERERRQALASLELARQRVLSDLQRACHANHRAMLEQALADLDRKIADG